MTLDPRTVDATSAESDPVAVALSREDVSVRLHAAARAFLGKWALELSGQRRIAEAEEIVSYASEQILKCRHGYNPDRDVVAWMVGFVLNATRDHLRKHARLPTGPPPNAPQLEDLAIDLGRPAAESVADRDFVARLMKQLKPDERRLMELKYHEDLTFAEIAVRTNSKRTPSASGTIGSSGNSGNGPKKPGGAIVTDRETQRRMDAIAMKYLTAVESGNFDAVADLWLAAQTDPDLSDMLHELNAELAHEQDAGQLADARAAIESAIETHMPSAEVIRPFTGPLQVAEVAEHLRRIPPRGLTADDLKANDVLRASADVVPADLGLVAVVSWGRKFGAASESYWEAFREAALLLRMRRESAENYQMVARPSQPQPKPPPKPAGGKS